MSRIKSFAAALGLAAILFLPARPSPPTPKAARRSACPMSAGPTSRPPPASPRCCSTALGYEPEVIVLSVPVTYASLKNKDLDVFLGNWMPSMTADIKDYTADGSVETIGENLEGAGYGIVVPTLRRRRRRQDADRHRQVQGQVRRQDLRHRGRQRRQPHHPRHDLQAGEQPRRLRAGRILGGRHADPGRAVDEGQ